MFTIKQAARLTGAPEATLRAWEKRYDVVAPPRTEAGYRLYDPDSITVLTAMRKLVDAGWRPAEAARALRDGSVPVAPATGTGPAPGDAGTSLERFLAAAAAMDPAGIEESLDQGLALGSFEHVVDAWLCPALAALGEGWARGEIDVAGEHAASHAVHRRLAQAYDAAGRPSRGPTVVVGLPAGSRHELGALAFATTCRRRGLDVLYLGADVPISSWDAAVRTAQARAVVIAVMTAADRPAAVATARSLVEGHPSLLVCAGGGFGDDLADGVRSLVPEIGRAAGELDGLVHDEHATRPAAARVSRRRRPRTRQPGAPGSD